MSRRTAVLTTTAVLACVVLPAGVTLLVSGASSGHDGRTVVGIVLALLGLVSLRILFWARRIRQLTRIGRSLHIEEQAGPNHGDGGDPCG
jgi:hypothetical protein